jgi:hypothetical protein
MGGVPKVGTQAPLVGPDSNIHIVTDDVSANNQISSNIGAPVVP